MLTKLRALASLYRELGPRWILFRIAYAFRLRSGLLRLQTPQYKWSDRPLETWLKKPNQTAGQVGTRVFHPIPIPGEFPPNLPWNPQNAIEVADRFLNGELKYFAHEFHQVGFPPNWHKDPVSGIELDSKKHWTQYSDDADVDLKFFWEPNRFFFVYTLVRAYVASRDEKYAEAFWQAIESWAEVNPPNTGPNWMDGQELALRLMAWTFGYHAFRNSPRSTDLRISQLTILIASHVERIYQNRSFAIFTRGNHAITEAFGLWMTGLLFPELKGSEEYLLFGKTSLEREARAQLFPDGTYSMYSLNYHRFVLHIYLYVMRLAELNHTQFLDDLIKLITKSIEYLSQLVDPYTGHTPVYGSNDGALILPLNNCDFTDYRPLLQLGWYITKGGRLFEPGPWDEDLFWLCGENSAGRAVAGSRYVSSERFDHQRSIETSGVGEIRSFPYGGNYLLHSSNSHALIRCTDFTARPSHADQLHVDLWMHGHNIAIDAGTYLYSGESVWRNGLARTSVHNTVIVDGKDQMTMLSRFTWTHWSKGKVLTHGKNLWQGEHNGYRPVFHKRTVMALDADRWLIVDHLAAEEPHHYALQWLLADGEYGIQKPSSANRLWLKPTKTGTKLPDSKFVIQMGLLKGKGDFSLVRADANSTRGWRSRYYGHKEPALSVMLEANQPQVAFWTFFGFEDDTVEVVGNLLRANLQEISLSQQENEVGSSRGQEKAG